MVTERDAALSAFGGADGWARADAEIASHTKGEPVIASSRRNSLANHGG
jgi:hypothetical protein